MIKKSHTNPNEINVKNLDNDLKNPFEELASALIRKYKSQIVSIVVFGSGTTGDWIRGKSDIDFIIVTDAQSNRWKIENFTNILLTKLSLKYDLRLDKTCSTFKSNNNPLKNLISTLESFMTFGKPFFVVSKNQIDVKKGKIKNFRIRFVTSIFNSIAIFVAKANQTGVTIYGENLLDQMYINYSIVEKIKAFIAPIWLIIVSFAVFPIDAQLSLSHSVKATIWSCEDALFFLERKLSVTELEIFELEKIFQNQEISLSHAWKANNLRPTLQGAVIEKGAIMQFLVQTSKFNRMLYVKTAEKWRFNQNK